MSKSKKITLIAVVAFIVAIALAAGIWFMTRPETEAGEKTFTLTLSYKDGTNEVKTLTSDKEFLGEALAAEGIIEYREDGFYTTVNGITADFSVDGGWWAVFVDGQSSNLGINEIPITSEGEYEVRYTTEFIF